MFDIKEEYLGTLARKVLDLVYASGLLNLNRQSQMMRVNINNFNSISICSTLPVMRLLTAEFSLLAKF